jgi:hypothetical protein
MVKHSRLKPYGFLASLIVGLLLVTYAALAAGIGPVSIESEDGVLVSARVVDDASSSRAKSVIFGGATSSTPCPKSGVGGEVNCVPQCLPGHVGSFPACTEQNYGQTLPGLNYSYVNNQRLTGTQNNPIIYDGVHFTEEVLLTSPENIVFRNCKFSKGVRLFGAAKNISFTNCIARGNHSYATDRWLYVAPMFLYWGSAGRDYDRTNENINLSQILVEEYSNDAIEVNGGTITIDDFVIRNMWADGQGVGDVDKCTNAAAAIFNPTSPQDSCGPSSQTFDPHVDGIKVHAGEATISRGLFRNISYQAIIGTRIPERGWRPVKITASSLRFENIGFQYTAPLCRNWSQTTLQYRVCGTSGGGTAVRIYDEASSVSDPRPDANGPSFTGTNLQQVGLNHGVWVSSSTSSWSLRDSTVTWIRLTPRSNEGNGPLPTLFTNNTRTNTRSDGYWQ